MQSLLATTLANGVLAGDRVLLARAITMVESTKYEHQIIAQETIALLLNAVPKQSSSLRIGISGAPGVGKSTLIEALGMNLVAKGNRVAVLAIDPSSSLSKGSILGDKTRMERLSIHPLAFIRPSPAGDTLGGVARKTRETILLVEAAGYDTVLVETVGVGQSEIAVHHMTDLFLLMLLPGAGDDLQGIKRGIVEMADLLAVNKTDGERVHLANQARAHYLNATHLLPAKANGWTPQVLACSALENQGIEALWLAMEAFKEHTNANGSFNKNRQFQDKYWMQESIESGLKSLFYGHPFVKNNIITLEKEVIAGNVSPFSAAKTILDGFIHAISEKTNKN